MRARQACSSSDGANVLAFIAASACSTDRSAGLVEAAAALTGRPETTAAVAAVAEPARNCRRVTGTTAL